MANVISLEAQMRVKASKGAARATRKAGRVPAVIYGGKKDSILVSLDPRDIVREMSHVGWQSRVYSICVSKDKTTVLMRDIQLHPVTDYPLHVDFMRLSAGEPIRVTVPVRFVGEEISPGIKRGGVLNIVRHDIEIECQPEHIPQAFTVDLSELDIHDNVRWSALSVTDKVMPILHGEQDMDFVIATIAPPTVEAEISSSVDIPENEEPSEN